MKILILKPSSLGDVVHALPVLRHLKKHYPSSEIWWWIDAGLVGLLQGDPDLTGVIPFHRKRWASPWKWDELFTSIFDLRRHQFDLVIDLQGLARSGIVAWLANGRYTIGINDGREGAAGCYDEFVPRPSATTHAVDWYLQVLHHLKVPANSEIEWIPSRPGMREYVHSKWPMLGEKRWILLNPSARWLNKRWPVQHYAALVNQLSARLPGYSFAVLGSKGDQELGAAICSSNDRCLDLTGKTSMHEMTEWLRAGDLMITNDTGPMHIAAALKRPIVALFGPTNPRRTGPYGQLENVLQLELPCVPCMKSRCTWKQPEECLRAMQPSAVAEVALRHLRQPDLGFRS